MRLGQISTRGREGSQGLLFTHRGEKGAGWGCNSEGQIRSLQFQDLGRNHFKISSQHSPGHCSLFPERG